MRQRTANSDRRIEIKKSRICGPVRPSESRKNLSYKAFFCTNALAQTPSWKSWAGLAFEAVCYKHLPQIQKALSISGDVSVGAWQYAPRNQEVGSGAQIDLLFDRADNAVTLCEIKYTEQPFLIDKKYAHNLLNKVERYQNETRTKKQTFIAMIASSGLKPSMYSEEIISKKVTLEDLYRET